MDNWKDYVGYQPIKELNDQGKAGLFYLVVGPTTETTPAGDTRMFIRIDKEMFLPEDFTLTEAEVGPAIETLMMRFPIINVANMVDLERAKLNVARETRRGVATTNWNDIWYYKGDSPTDSPIIVVSYEGKYAIFEHPKFMTYGFVVENKTV